MRLSEYVPMLLRLLAAWPNSAQRVEALSIPSQRQKRAQDLQRSANFAVFILATKYHSIQTVVVYAIRPKFTVGSNALD